MIYPTIVTKQYPGAFDMMVNLLNVHLQDRETVFR